MQRSGKAVPLALPLASGTCTCMSAAILSAAHAQRSFQSGLENSKLPVPVAGLAPTGRSLPVEYIGRLAPR